MKDDNLLHVVWSAVDPFAMICVAGTVIQKYFVSVRFYGVDERMIRVTSAGVQI